MKGINGELNSLPLTDLMQWIEMNRKTGTLFVSNGGAGKCFCFEGGRLLLAASNSEGGRFADFITMEGKLGRSDVERAMEAGRKEGTPFTVWLMEKGLIGKEPLSASIQRLAEDNVMEVLSWGGGQFKFVEELPRAIAGSPIRLNTGFTVFESARKYDEKARASTPEGGTGPTPMQTKEPRTEPSSGNP
jgi:hypothetical protein